MYMYMHIYIYMCVCVRVCVCVCACVCTCAGVECPCLVPLVCILVSVPREYPVSTQLREPRLAPERTRKDV